MPKIIFILIFSSLLTASRLERKIDSLKLVLNNQSDVNKVFTYKELSKSYEHYDLNEALRFIDSMNYYAYLIKDTNNIILSNILEGRYYHLNKKSALGRNYLDKARELIDHAKDDSLKTLLYDNYGLNFRNNFIFDSAEYYYNKGYEIAEKNKDTFRMANIKNNLALITRDIAAHYLDRGQKEKADEMFNNGIKTLYESLEFLKGSSYYSLEMEIYYLIYGIQTRLNHKEEALSNLLIFADYQKKEYGEIEPLVLAKLATLYAELGKQSKAKNIIKNVLKNINLEINSNKLMNLYIELYKYYYAMGEHKEALFYLDKKISIIHENRRKQFNDSDSGRLGEEFYGSKYLQLDQDMVVAKDRSLLLNKMNMEKVNDRNLIIYGFSFFTLLVLLLFYFVFRQTKKLNKLNQKLVGETELKQKLFGIITHDLKKPLINISYGLDFMKNLDKRNIDEVKYNKYINIMLDNSNQLLELTNNILDWSRSQTDQIKVNKSNFILEELINEAIDIYKLYAKNKNIEIICDIKVGNIFSDKKLLLIVIQNILNNAIKYTLEGELININAFTENSHIVIMISDTGVGIDKQYLDKLFDSKFNTSEIKNADNKGTGLGLQVCREFVELIGGKISVKSKINEGSTFRIELPI